MTMVFNPHRLGLVHASSTLWLGKLHNLPLFSSIFICKMGIIRPTPQSGYESMSQGRFLRRSIAQSHSHRGCLLQQIP